MPRSMITLILRKWFDPGTPSLQEPKIDIFLVAVKYLIRIIAQCTHQLLQFSETFSSNSRRKTKSSTLLNTITRCRAMV